MEEDKKKKKSKKKKNKQNKTTTDNSLDGLGPGALVSYGENIITAPMDAAPPDAQHYTASTVDVDPENHHPPGVSFDLNNPFLFSLLTFGYPAIYMVINCCPRDF